MKQFKGSTSEYVVVGSAKGVEWGVSLTMNSTTDVVVRFACLGMLKKPPVHFNYRMATQQFKADGDTAPQEGMYFDKITIPVMKSPVPYTAYVTFMQDMDIPAILGEWIVRQFTKEDIHTDPAAIDCAVAKIMGDSDAPPKSTWKFPSDIWHEPKTYDENSIAQTKLTSDLSIEQLLVLAHQKDPEAVEELKDLKDDPKALKAALIEILKGA